MCVCVCVCVCVCDCVCVCEWTCTVRMRHRETQRAVVYESTGETCRMQQFRIRAQDVSRCESSARGLHAEIAGACV